MCIFNSCLASLKNLKFIVCDVDASIRTLGIKGGRIPKLVRYAKLTICQSPLGQHTLGFEDYCKRSRNFTKIDTDNWKQVVIDIKNRVQAVARIYQEIPEEA